MSSSSPDFAPRIAVETGLSPSTVTSVLSLLDDGCTVPFIARYRKEATGGAEDVSIERVLERATFHREFHQRRQTILASIEERGLLTSALRRQIEEATTRTRLEDIYLPFRPKRRTRATIARERGLQDLADRMWARADRAGSIEDIAQQHLCPDKDVSTADDALSGARDIVAERIIETPEWRSLIREFTWKRGLLRTKAARGKKDVTSKYSDYYDYQEPVSRIATHRVLAVLRGEKEGFLSVRIGPDPERAHELLSQEILVGGRSVWDDQLRLAAVDGYDRLLSSQIETEIRLELKSRADAEAIDVFAANLEDLLMMAPFGSRPLLAIDPGFRTGCKVVVLGATGQLLDHGVVYPTEPRRDLPGTERALDAWFERHPDLAAVVVGNGTGGREAFAMVRDYLERRHLEATAILTNESGASIYSASEVAREEFPHHDVTVRGAISIGRRVQDPLAELVKIDPKSIGVGQYQHDVDQRRLKERLDDVVRRCVNRVGVDVNTASSSLLTYVSGLGPKLARSILAHRDQEGAFTSRAQLKKVSGLGAKTFVQAAGFLRVKGPNPLDDSAVHPERYSLVRAMAKGLGREVRDLIGDAQAVQSIDRERYLDDTVGIYTIEDILAELLKPGRDPRDDFEAVAFRDDLQDITDLQEGMLLTGVVTNVTNFGAFVDLGVHQDGLVHVSQIAHRFVQNPADELSVGQQVRVKVMQVDLERQRIGLSIKEADE